MVKFNFRNKFLSILAAVTILVGAMPVMAEDGAGISITTTKTNWDSGYAFTNADGGGFLVMQMTEGQIKAENKPWVAYSVYVEEAGKYKITFKSSPLTDGKYTSPATFTVNSNAVETALKQSIDVNTKIYTSVVNLEEGENEFRFTVKGSRPNTGTDGLFHLYYLNCDKYSMDSMRFEGEGTKADGRDFTASFYDSGSGFKYSHANSVADITAGNIWWKYSFNSAEGKYKFTWRSTDIDGTQYVSPVKLTVNGEEITAQTKKADGDPWFIQTNEVYLKAGLNEVKFMITATKNFGAGDAALVYIDYIDFQSLESNDAESKEYYNLKFEGEDATGSKEVISDQDGYSAKAWNRVRGTATTEFVTPADDFDLFITVGADVDASQHTNGKYLGKAAISIDNGDFIELNGTNMTKVADLSGNGAGIENAAKWKYNPGLTLGSGEHTFAIKYAGVGSGNKEDNDFIHYDCFELTPKNGIIEKAVITFPQNKVICGEQIQMLSGLYYTNGCMVEDTKIDSNATKYISSNSVVASINNDGVITTINPGFAEISVIYNDIYENTYTDSIELIVCDESGIIPVSSSYDEKTGEAIVKLTRIMDATGDAVVIFGAYSTENGVITSFKNLPTAITVNPERGRVTTLLQKLSGDNICVFIWDKENGLKPLSDFIKLK